MRWVVGLPLIVFLGLVAVFAVGLRDDGPDVLPSPLIGQPVPDFSLAPIEGYRAGGTGVDPDVLALGRPSLVNYWASWCAPCRAEHPLLMELNADPRIDVVGINYKDAPEDAARFLQSLGDPFDRIGADTSGRAAIAWGVYGVPETFLVDGEGVIVTKYVGQLTADVMREVFMPEIEALAGE
ncbi:MAG: DsbE family thiol:disulfide interchange protein [Pseudomonadota bacterium]